MEKLTQQKPQFEPNGLKPKRAEMQLRLLDQNISQRDLNAIVDAEKKCGLDMPFSRNDVANMLGSKFYQGYGLYDHNKLAGYCFLAQNIYKSFEAYIFDIGVCPKYQGKGVGTELLCKAVSHYLTTNKHIGKYIGRVRLDVALDNQRALNLYQKMGFTEDDLRPLSGYGNQVMSVGKSDFLHNANDYLQNHGYTTYTTTENTLTK